MVKDNECIGVKVIVTQGGEGIPIRQGPGTVTPHQGYQCLGLLPYRRYTPTHSLVLIVLTSLGL